MAKPALGRGLGALLGGARTPVPPPAPPPAEAAPVVAATATPESAETHAGVQQIAVERIRPCPFQPRKEFTEAALEELADSIREQGIVQPLIVRARSDHFELIAGERRLRAAQRAGLAQVPVLVREANDDQVLELALIENLQRENLNPLEEAQGYRQLTEQFGLRQEDVAVRVGKSRVAVANALRLLRLPPDVQEWLREGRLTVGHAKVILGFAAAEQQRRAAEHVLGQGLNVRQTEELVARWQQTPSPTPTAAPAATSGRDLHVVALESRLQERFGTKVNVRYRKGRGAVEIRFFSDDELERILQSVGVAME